MAKKKNRIKWKALTIEEKKNVINDYNNQILRNQIMRKYDIPPGQLVRIVSETGAYAKII